MDSDESQLMNVIFFSSFEVNEKVFLQVCLDESFGCKKKFKKSYFDLALKFINA